MDELLNKLSDYSYDLYKLNMRQVAGDYAYFVAWMQSTDPDNPAKHYGVIPAGEDTIAPFANNCPIPYTVSVDLVYDCTNNDSAISALNHISDVLTNMETYVAGDEIYALNVYKEYTSDILSYFE